LGQVGSEDEAVVQLWKNTLSVGDGLAGGWPAARAEKFVDWGIE